MKKHKTKPTDLREACLREALTIVETEGLEKLSLREVSRRLGVSHQAPYKHFPSRDHILAEVVSRAYTAFAEYLEARPRTDDPREDLRTMGEAYFRYALEHPLQYRLMFGTPLPDPQEHPRMMENAQRAFSLLREAVRQRSRVSNPDADPAIEAERDALFIWSTIHGLSTILQSHALETLELSPEVLAEAIPTILNRIRRALEPGHLDAGEE